MAVRPWDNQFVDINLKDGITVHEYESEELNSETTTKFRSTSTKNISSNLHPNLVPIKTGASHSDGNDSSSTRSPTLSGKPKPKKTSSAGPREEANSKQSRAGLRSYSNPKERPSQESSKAKKRMSLPNRSELFLTLVIFHDHIFFSLPHGLSLKFNCIHL